MKMVQAIAEALVREHVDTIFTVIDDPILALVQELSERGIRIISARHEQSAVAMADGYARAAHRLAVCVIGAGPALAQTGTALITAQRNRSPLLVLTGDTPDILRHHVKRFDQRAFIQSTAGAAFMVRDEKNAADMLHDALRHIECGQGPAIVNLPSDVLDGDATQPWQKRRLVPPPELPDAMILERIATALAHAKRPIILAGGGALGCGRDAILKLAERSGALLATTIRTREWFRGDQRDLGLMGSFSTPAARRVFGQADLLLAIGTSLNAYILGTAYGPGPLLTAGAVVARIDRDDPHRADWPVEHALTGDARNCVAGLLERLDPGSQPPWAEVSPQPATEPEPAKFTARAALTALDRMMPEHRMVAVDCGAFVFPVLDAIRCPAESFLWTMNFGSVGLSLAMGIGAAVARPDLPCFIFMGDGGFTMAPQELITAVTYHIAITVVILDDGAYGAEARILEARGKPADLALLANPDLAGMARAMGAQAVSLRGVDDLVLLREQVATPERGPLVVHARVRREDGHHAAPSQDTGVRK